MKISPPTLGRCLARLCLAMATLTLCAGQTSAADTAKKIRLAYAGWELGTAVAYVGVDSGLFKKHGLM